MTRLSQIIAIEKDTKTRAEDAGKFAYHQLQKYDPEKPPLSGILKTYKARDDAGEQLPSQGTRVQYSVEEALRDVTTKTARYLDLLGTKERTDQVATANVVVDGEVFIKDAPVLLLLGLERQLNEELEQARKLPTLSPEYEWDPADSHGVYVSEPVVTTRSKKVRRNHVKAEATDKFPAQVETYDEDTVVGDWTTKRYCGAIPLARKQGIIDRLVKLITAVQQAREEANTTAVVDFKIGDKILGYAYGLNGAGK